MNVLEWINGGQDHTYINLLESIGGDISWLILFIILKTLIVVPYLIIAAVWWKVSRSANKNHGQESLTGIMWIFFFSIFVEYILSIGSIFYPMFRIEVIMNIPLLILMILFLKRIKHIKLWYLSISKVQQDRIKLQKLEWERNTAEKLYREKDQSMMDMSKALGIISTTKKRISQGKYDSAI